MAAFAASVIVIYAVIAYAVLLLIERCSGVHSVLFRQQGALLVQPTRLQLALPDPQVRSKIGIIAADRLDEVLGLLAMDEAIDGVAKWRGRREKV